MSKPKTLTSKGEIRREKRVSQGGYTYLYSIKVFCVCSTNSYSSSNISRQRTAFLKGNLSKSVNLRLNVSDSDELTQFKIKCILNNLRQFKTIIQRTRLINIENRSINMERGFKQ